MLSMGRLTRSLFLIAVVLAHLVSVPLVIEVQRSQSKTIQDMRMFYMYVMWMPLLTAQIALLIVYFAFGSGRLLTRAILFSLGLGCVLFGLMWAKTRIRYYSVEDVWFDWESVGDYIELANTEWISQILPAVLVGLILLPLRPLTGAMRSRDTNEPEQFSIITLFLITLATAITIAWRRTLGPPTNWEVQFASLILPVTCALALLVMTLSRWWWTGVILIFLAVAATRIYVVKRFAYFSPVDRSGQCVFFNSEPWVYMVMPGLASWIVTIYPWLVVAITLLIIRALGYQLKSPSRM